MGYNAGVVGSVFAWAEPKALRRGSFPGGAVVGAARRLMRLCPDRPKKGARDRLLAPSAALVVACLVCSGIPFAFTALRAAFPAVFPGACMAYAAERDWWGHWAEAEIVYAFHKGIVTGYPDGTFRPDASCSRSEFVVLLLRALGEDDEAAAMKRHASRLLDVPISHWAHGYLELAYTWGLVTPDRERRVFPEAPLTRAEMAIAAWMAIGRFGLARMKGFGQALPFVDSGEIPTDAVDAVSRLHSLGVVTGDDRRAFRPNAPVTRAEALVMCVRVLGVLGNRWDLEGEVIGVDEKNRIVTLDTGLERLSLPYAEDFLAVYQNGRRLRVDAIAVGSRVGVVFKEGVFPTLSYVLVMPGQD
ncbi:MAG TPA: S-layer homology domain-containing protein [Firmicutes bacterium]|nr:S-layer homology domain-containing protein [Candidatus Fermentithermobacillaceae bacterium]